MVDFSKKTNLPLYQLFKNSVNIQKEQEFHI